MTEFVPEVDPAPENEKRGPFSTRLVVVSAVVLIAAFLAVALIWGGERAIPGRAQPIPCPREISVFFQVDADMMAASEKLRGDKRFESMTTATRQQTYERFMVIFKDRPDLVGAVRPENLPASVTVTARSESELRPLESTLRAEFPGANQVQARCVWLK